MSNKELFVKAHKMAKEIKNEYPEVDYMFQFSLCLSYLREEGENGMVELKGTEKQVKWAEDIRKIYLEGLNDVKKKIEEVDRYIARDYYLSYKEEVHARIKENTSEEKKKALLDIIDVLIEKVENQEKSEKFIRMYNLCKEVSVSLTTRIYRLW